MALSWDQSSENLIRNSGCKRKSQLLSSIVEHSEDLFHCLPNVQCHIWWKRSLVRSVLFFQSKETD